MLIYTGKRGVVPALIRVASLAPLALVSLVTLAFIGCGTGPSTAGGTTMPIVKAADAANVCYIQPTEELKAKLSPEQFAVLVQNATEPPFQNAFWDNHTEGIYVDAIDGAPLFASSTKFDSGTGWPSFWAPIDPSKITLVEDLSLGMSRIEVRSKASGGHLGHLFNDGPNPTGLRYCINSASLRFVPRDQMAAEGYADLDSIFTKP